METFETIERGQYRARIVLDMDAEMPYGDALAPVFRIGGRPEPYGVVSDYTPTDLMPGDVSDALERFGNDRDKVERYLRMFHGVTAVEWAGEPHAPAAFATDLFIVMDTPDWRKHVGLSGDAPSNIKGDADEWRAWIEGEVYGVIVERRVKGATFWHDGTSESVERWNELDSCYGFYGFDSAKEHAESELKAL